MHASAVVSHHNIRVPQETSCFFCRIGALLFKGEWKAAVELIMGRVEGERSENDEARRLFLENGDVGGALRLMQRHLTAERSLLEVGLSSLHHAYWQQHFFSMTLLYMTLLCMR